MSGTHETPQSPTPHVPGPDRQRKPLPQKPHHPQPQRTSTAHRDRHRHSRQRFAGFRRSLTFVVEVRTNTSGISTNLVPTCQAPPKPREALPQMSREQTVSANPCPKSPTTHRRSEPLPRTVTVIDMSGRGPQVSGRHRHPWQRFAGFTASMRPMEQVSQRHRHLGQRFAGFSAALTSVAEVRTVTSGISTNLVPPCQAPPKPRKALPQMSREQTVNAKLCPTCHRTGR